MAYANSGLFCPDCGVKSFVSDSAIDKENNELYRERTCTRCGKVFFTTEFVVDEDDKFRELWLKLKLKYNRERKKEREKKNNA
jgi:transcriptional regulator NrdR family protein